MIFWLKILEIFNTVLGFDDKVDDQDRSKTASSEKFEKDDYLCHGQIVNALYDKLFDLYCEIIYLSCGSP